MYKKLLLLALAIPLVMIAGCSAQPVDTQTGQTPVVITTNEFKLSDLKVGLEIAGLKVTSLGPFNAQLGPMSENNLKVNFEGNKTVSGIYAPAEDLSMVGLASFSLDDASLKNFPKLIDDEVGRDWFTFNGSDKEVVAKLGKVKKDATIVIKNYTLQRYPAEVSSMADLVEVKENTSSSETTQTYANSTDLEKTIVLEKDELFRTYDKISKDLSSGYPVVFSNTTDPDVRFTKLTNSGGDAMHTTLYFINQGLQKILQVDTDVYGGDFGDAGNLTLSLNGESTAVIELEKDVDDKRQEITYKGLRVNEKTVLTFKNPLIFRPKGAIAFTMLGVSSDLTHAYFSEGIKKFSYDITSNKIQEVTELPAIAKPVTK